MPVACVELVYEKCGSEAYQSCTKKNPGFVKHLMEECDNVYNPGNGWVYVYNTSRLLLILEDGMEIDVAPFFKEHWGNLTENRRAAIEEAMPKSVTLVDDCLKLPILESWFSRAKEKDSPAARKLRKINQKKQEENQKKQEEKQKKQEEEWLKEKEAQHQARLAAAPKMTFHLGWNKKRQREEWQQRQCGKLYVLLSEHPYKKEDGAVPIEEIRTIGAEGTVVLVGRLDVG